ncbi:hypothetical protein D9M73_258980 [compost metagenome]
MASSVNKFRAVKYQLLQQIPLGSEVIVQRSIISLASCRNDFLDCNAVDTAERKEPLGGLFDALLSLLSVDSRGFH